VHAGAQLVAAGRKRDLREQFVVQQAVARRDAREARRLRRPACDRVVRRERAARRADRSYRSFTDGIAGLIHGPTRTKLKLVCVGTKTLAADADILLKRPGLRTVVTATAAGPLVTATVRPAVEMEMSCKVKPPPAVFVGMTVAVEPGGMDGLPGATATTYRVPTASRPESIGWMTLTTTVPVGEVFPAGVGNFQTGLHNGSVIGDSGD
jgi:hypothetical protein